MQVNDYANKILAQSQPAPVQEDVAELAQKAKTDYVAFLMVGSKPQNLSNQVGSLSGGNALTMFDRDASNSFLLANA